MRPIGSLAFLRVVKELCKSVIIVVMLISRLSRLKYDLSLDYFRPDGHVIFSDLASARAFAAQMSALRSDPVPATDLYALSLLDYAYHILLKHFFLSRHTDVMARAMGMVQSNPGSKYH